MVRNAKWIWERPGWPEFTWDTAALAGALGRAHRAQGETIGRTQLFDATLDREAQLEILALEGLNTSAIEGERLDMGALRSSIARRLGMPTAGLPPAPRHVEGLVDVLIDATENRERVLTRERLCSWQASLFPSGYSGLRKIRAGKLRGPGPMRIVSGPIGRERVHYEAPPRKGLVRELDRFVAWFNSPPRELDGILRAGLAHLWFEIIHPFEDGNGRVGRAIVDMALAQREARSMRVYSLSACLMKRRDEYYQALSEASRGPLDVTPFLRWFLAEVAAAAQASQQIIERVLVKARFWLHHSQTDLNQRQRKALNRMLDAGIGGFQGGMSSRKYAHLTKTSPATAFRELDDLTKKGCLVLVGAGRAARYELVLPTVPTSRSVHKILRT